MTISAAQKPAIAPSILEAAATWYVDLQQNPDKTTSTAHQQWLNEHPLHRRAWARVEKLQKTFTATPASLANTTLSHARASRRQAIKALSCLLMAGASGAVLWQKKNRVQGLVAQYGTATGERRKLTLADGGVLHLNTATAIDVDYNETGRDIHLYGGELQVTTAHDVRQRPFIVHTPQGSVRALGTRFLVRSDNQKTHVNVLEHAVEIRTKKAGHVARIEAGQQMHFTAQQASTIQPLQSNSGAWLQGLLVVSDWRLDQFLSELLRYRAGRLSCDDSIASLRISGAFHLNNTDTVLENLAATLPIRIHYFTRYWVRVGAV